jgi:CheY-like chemotaxis protein
MGGGAGGASSTPGGVDQMRLLIIDDDDSVRNLCKARLGNDHDILDTGDPERAILMCLQYKPDAILLDLSMPKLTGFELCKTFSTLTLTQHIPILVLSGEDIRNKAFCEKLGATAYFEKPIDFARLKSALSGETPKRKADLRAHSRADWKVLLKLRGKDKQGQEFEIRGITENISAGGFLASCNALPEESANLEVFFCSGDEHYLGRARPVRIESADRDRPRIGFQFIETSDWTEQKAPRDAVVIDSH